MGAGADLVDAVDAVVTRDLDALSLEQLQQEYATTAGQGARLSGYTGAVLARLHQRTGGLLPTDDGRTRSLAGWAADASGETPSAAGRLIRVSTALQEGLPLVAQAVLDGDIPFRRAEVLSRLVGQIRADSLLEAQADLITAAQTMDADGLAAYVRHLLATWVEPRLDDEGASQRYLKTRQENDGSLWGSFRIAAGDSETFLTAIEPLAGKQGLEDTRSAAQRRADALTEVCEQVLRHGDLPDAGGQRPQMSYVLPAEWAARRADEQDCADCRHCSRHLPTSFADLVAAGVPGSSRPSAEHTCAVAAWTGPQTRSRIEALLCDARITRVLLDERGQVKGLEPLRDSITPAQRRALAARDVRCVARGCTRPPAMCDAHHLTARADGGPTVLHNLVLLCRRHHVLCTSGSWCSATCGCRGSDQSPGRDRRALPHHFSSRRTRCSSEVAHGARSSRGCAATGRMPELEGYVLEVRDGVYRGNLQPGEAPEYHRRPR